MTYICAYRHDRNMLRNGHDDGCIKKMTISRADTVPHDDVHTLLSGPRTIRRRAQPHASHRAWRQLLRLPTLGMCRLQGVARNTKFECFESNASPQAHSERCKSITRAIGGGIVGPLAGPRSIKGYQRATRFALRGGAVNDRSASRHDGPSSGTNGSNHRRSDRSFQPRSRVSCLRSVPYIGAIVSSRIDLT